MKQLSILPIFLIKHVPSGQYAHQAGDIQTLRSSKENAIGFYVQEDADRELKWWPECVVEKVFDTTHEIVEEKVRPIVEYQVRVNHHKYTVCGYRAATAFSEYWDGTFGRSLAVPLGIPYGTIHADGYNIYQALYELGKHRL
jgi:hypothetical protein